MASDAAPINSSFDTRFIRFSLVVTNGGYGPKLFGHPWMRES